MPYEPEEWLPDAPVWTPPKSTPPPVQQQTQPTGMLDSILGALSWHPDIWGPKAAEYAEPALKYGEQGNDLSHRAVGAAGAFTANFGKLVDSVILNPTNLALFGLSGGSSALASAAGSMENFAAKQAVMRAAQAMQFPGRVASGAMLGHGVYRATDENAPWDEKASGIIEGILGGMGLRAPGITVPKIEVLPAEPIGTSMVPRTNPIEGAMPEPAPVPRAPIIPPQIASEQNLRVNPQTGLQFAGDSPIKSQERPPLSIRSMEEAFTGEPEEWTPPEEPKGPDFMRVPGSDNVAMGGADPRVLKTIGSNLYSRERPSTVVKELLQNSFDEHRQTGQTAPINVLLNREDAHPVTKQPASSVTVNDKGRGLTKDELYTIFTDVGKTGKAGIDSASGGFGFAKAAPMLTGDYFRATSIVNEGGRKVRYTVNASPSEMLNQKVGVPIAEEDAPPNAHTGLTVTTYFPNGTNLTNANELATNIAKWSPSVTSPVHIIDHYGYMNPERMEQYLHNNPKPWEGSSEALLNKHYKKTIKQEPELPYVDTIKLPGSEINIHYNEPKPDTEASGYNLHVLNKGLYQETHTGRYGLRPVMNVPGDITADVKATVEEGEEGYPYTASRENLDVNVKNAIDKWIEDNITSGALKKRASQLEALYDSMPEFNVGETHRPGVLFDPGNRLTPRELMTFHNSNAINNIVRIIDTSINDIVTTAGKPHWATKLEKTGIVLDPGMYGVHIPNPHANYNKSVILINPLAHVQDKYSDPLKAAWGTTVTMLHEVAHIGSEGYGAGEFKTQVSQDDLDDPRLGKFLASFLEHMQVQGGLPGHGLEFVKRLGETFTTFGAQRTFGVAHAIHKAITDESGGYSPEIQNLLSIYKESRRREPTTTDYLSGTGIKHETPKGGEGDASGDIKANGNGTPSVNQRAPIDDVKKFTPELQASVEKLKAGIKLGLDARRMQDKMYSIERAKRAAAAGSVKTPGIKGYYEQLGMLRGELPKIPSGSQLQQKDVDNLIDAITNSDLDFYKSINAKAGLLKVMTGRAPQLSEMVHLNKVFGKDFGELIMLHGGLGAVPIKDLVNNVVNVPKSIMASIDLSAPLRQGLPLIYRGEWWNSFKSMFDYAGSEKAFQDSQDVMMAHPNFKMWDDVGLFLAGIDENLARREEAFLSPLAEQIPIAGKLIRGSERAYVGFLNKLRFDSANALLDEAKNMGHQVMTKEVNEKTGEVTEAPAKIVHDIANFLNVSTGRGSLGRFEKNAVELNAAIFSPRMISANLTMLNPKYYVDKNTHPFVRKEALKALLAVAAAGLLTTQLAKRMGGQVNSNPISSDFGKAKFGNTRVDPWRGFQQYVVAAARFTSGKTTSTNNETRDLGTGVMPTRMGVIAGVGNKYSPSLLENKLSPIASFIDDMLSGRTYPPGGVGQLVTDKVAQHTYGDKPAQFAVPKRVSGEIINRYTPMFISDLVDVLRDNPRYIPLTLLGLFGYGVQTFGPKANPRASQDQQQGVQP